MNERQISKAKLKKRAERLVELVSSSSHPSLIAEEIALVIKAGMGYCPKALSQNMEFKNHGYKFSDGTENSQDDGCLCWNGSDECKNGV